MTDQKIKELISKWVLPEHDEVQEMCLRKIIFDSSTTIDWQKTYRDIVLKYMPELALSKYH